MRDAFFDELTRLAQFDPRIVFLTADLGYKLWDEFAERCPGRFFNMGVSEANMVSVAAGLALSGYRPVTYSIVPFATVRCLEQIRNDVCNMKLPVLLVGVGGGYAYGANGPTHHGIDDVALLRVMPNMSVFCPCDPIETKATRRAALRQKMPAYLRLGRNKEPNLVPEDFRLWVGEPTVLRNGHTVALLACGPIAKEALDAADSLTDCGLSAMVLSAHTVKPIARTVAFLRKRGIQHVFVVEEHSPCGGLAEALAIEIADADYRPRVTRLSAPDRFLSDVGSQQYMRKMAGLDGASIARKVRDKVTSRAPVRVDK